MAKFNKGDWVEISEYARSWHYWRRSRDVMIGKPCQVISAQESKTQTGVIYLRVSYGKHEAWITDSYCIKVDNYDIIYSENLKQACDTLQEHERVCKKLRDEILEGVFGEEEREQKEEKEDVLYEDWEGVKTKEIVPLPGSQVSNIDLSSFSPNEWMTDEEIEEYYGFFADADEHE